MKEKSLLLQLTGEMPLFKIIDFLVDNKGMDFTKKDLIEGANMSRATLFNYWPQIERYGIIKVTRAFGKTKLYTLNSSNIIVKRILDLEATLIRSSMEKSSKKELLVAR